MVAIEIGGKDADYTSIDFEIGLKRVLPQRKVLYSREI